MEKNPSSRLPEYGPSRRLPAGDRFTIPLPSFPRRPASEPRRGAGAAPASRPESADAQGPTNCLWVNQIGNRIVGLVRLAAAGPDTARIVTFRIDPEWYHTAVVTDLIQAVSDHCRQHGCVRVLVDFHVAPPWMPSVLRRHGFRVAWHRRTWEAILDGAAPETGPEFPEL